MLATLKLQARSGQLLVYFIGLAYLLGILNYMHLLPSKRSLNVGLQVLLVLSIGLAIVWSQRDFVFRRLGWSAAMWLSLLGVILIQPLVNIVIYPDSLIFTVGALVFVSLLSVTVYQVEDKATFTRTLSWFIWIGALLTFFTQLAQLLQWTFLFHNLVYPVPAGGRPVSNLVQPNQAAFVYAMGIAAACYLQDIKITSQSRWVLVFFGLSVLILGSGIGISASRGGIILGLAAIIGYYLLNERSLKSRLTTAALFIVLGVVGYVLGSYLLSSYSPTPTAIDKIATTTQSLRGAQLEQALLIFQDNPLFGIGWGNFSTSALIYAEQLPWVSMTDHSHFIVSNIASELGILGLLIFIPFIYIIYKNIRLRLQPSSAFVLSILGVITLYSFSEFPLWYFYFLMLFAVFLALADIKISDVVQISLKRIFTALLVVIMLLSVYYYQAFMSYNKVADLTTLEISDEQKLALVTELNTPYGFTQYKEYLLYHSLSVSSEQLDEKIAIGERVVSLFPAPYLMMQQGLLYGLKGDVDKNLDLFKAACLFDFARDCDNVQDALIEARDSQPEYYQQVLDVFIAWRAANPERTRLSAESDNE
ncbi:O-antigen ligase family protein [uncultured Psychrobacter sp.]|uniref:PglL family O-oligosaccharyltransferase n=1 Tax=uncultured Psychrobacter sp. TaxID=259303 RepID=UPI002596D641|nr:O-antigen ligase family protein [uncultured Psychrobacter sp.]